jgi:hypothetical protein
MSKMSTENLLVINMREKSDSSASTVEVEIGNEYCI